VQAPIFTATAHRTYPPIQLALAGQHQVENAAVAVAILERWSEIAGHVSTEAIVTGLTQCEWPARLEWLRVPSAFTRDASSGETGAGGDLLIDAAHNPAGAAALASYLRETGSQKLPIVFAAMADKDVKQMIGALAPIASRFIATTVPNSRARSADQLAAEIRALAPTITVEEAAPPEAAVARAFVHANRAVACGSIYMIGPLRARLIAAGATRL
jgi:dihydrofolate synthase/folylpolyglutamate synthase